MHSKERKRAREKYHRLHYRWVKKPKDPKPQNRYRKKYPEKLRAKHLSQHMKVTKGFQKHHWSYNLEHIKDILEMTSRDHAKLHRYMVYDQERMMYRTLEGILLDTKKRHVEYLESIKDKD